MRVAIVHYHLDPGGVTRVIESASHALTGARIQHVILTGSPGGPLRNFARSSHAAHLPVRHVDGIGYLTTPGSLTAESLTTMLRATATEALGAPPDVWHFHNHSLGKNRLIAEVVARLAEAGERLVLQLHDLAEHGRPANYPLIADCPKLYPFSPAIHYTFLNSRDRDVFTAAGLPVANSSILANPVPCSGVNVRNEFTGLPAILFAPIRGIRRKNLGELVLLAALAPAGSHFAVSRAPSNPAALPIHDTWKQFARKQGLPIELDVVDHFSPAAGASADFESWCARATHFVTTSIEEGFGLPFLEAIAHGKPLIGRDLPYLTAAHARHGFRCGRLYEKILIPLDWVDLTILESYLATTLERNHRYYGRPLANAHIAAVLESLVHRDLIDFGNLPEPLQQGVIEKLDEPSSRGIPLVQIEGNTQPLDAWLAGAIANRQPTATTGQLAPYSIPIYQETITSIYLHLVRQPAPPVAFLPPAEILTAFLTPEAFHFLLSAPEPIPPAVKFRAVIFDIYGTLLIGPAGGVKPDSAADPRLRQVLEFFGYQPPESPSTELHAAVLSHHAAAGVAFPEVDLRVLWREVLSLDPDTDTTSLVEAIEAAWHPVRPMPGAEKLIQRLARSCISLGLLSNAQSNTLASLGPVSDLFAPELTILSYQHGIAKPAPELFNILTDRLAGRGISPAETLFIGNDPQQDIAPAAAAGFQTALFTGHPDSLRPGDCQPDFILENWKQLLPWI